MLRQGERSVEKGDIYHQGTHWRLPNLRPQNPQGLCQTPIVGAGNEVCDSCEEVDAGSAFVTFPEEDLQSLKTSNKRTGERLERTGPGGGARYVTLTLTFLNLTLT